MLVLVLMLTPITEQSISTGFIFIEAATTPVIISKVKASSTLLVFIALIITISTSLTVL